MDLFVRTLTGTLFELRVSPFESILSIKGKIQRFEGIPMSKQHLIWLNVDLEDDYCLHDYGIMNGTTLTLVLSMRDGPINMRQVSIEEPEYQDVEDLMESNNDEIWEKLTSDGKQVTLLVFRDGDQMNFFRVYDCLDDTLTPYPDSLSTSSVYNQPLDEDPVQNMSKNQNALTKDKMKALKEKMVAKHEKKVKPPKIPVVRASSKCSTTGQQVQLARSGSRVKSIPKEHAQFLTKHLMEGQAEYSLQSLPSQVSPCPPFHVQQPPSHTPQPPSRVPHPPLQVPSSHAPRMPSPVSHPPLPTLPPVNCSAVKSSSPSGHGLRKNVVTSTCATCLVEHSHCSTSSTCSSCKKRKNKLPGLHGMTERISRMNSREETYNVSTPGRSRRRVLQPIVGKVQEQKDGSSNVVSKTTDDKISSSLRTFNSGNLKENSQLPDVGNYTRLLNWTRPKSTAAKKANKKGAHSTYERKSSSKMNSACMNQLPPVRHEKRFPPMLNGKKKVRCLICTKKLGLATTYQCRCGGIFCATHRYPETHTCSYDYKTEGRKFLQKNNPVVAASKLPKI